MNTFYSLLRGGHRYKSGNVLACDANYINWGEFGTWFDDLCNQNIGFGPGYHWTNGSNAERALWFPRKTKKLYGLPYTGFQSGSNASFGAKWEWDWGSSSFTAITSVTNSMNRDSTGSGFELVTWCGMYSPNSWDWLTPGAISSFGGLYVEAAASTIALFRLENLADSNKVAIFVKPVGIDRLGLNWFDNNKYDLYGYYTQKDRTQHIKKVTTSFLGTSEERFNDVVWVEKSNWQDDAVKQRGYPGFNTKSNFMPATRFFLKDKTTGAISRLSESKVVLSLNHTNAPMKYEIVKSVT